jgi:hypothetical protein
MRGDPFLGGLLKTVGGVLGGVAKTVGGFVPGPAGMVLKAAGGVLAPQKPQAGPLPSPQSVVPQVVSQTQFGPAGVIYKKTEYGASVQSRNGAVGKRRRRMNPLNVKALRRAGSRLNSFRTAVKGVAKAAGVPVTFGARKGYGRGGSRCNCRGKCTCA